MKIIGETSDGYILTASKDEISNLIGYYSAYSNKYENKVFIGSVINVADMYKKLYDLDRNKDELEKTAKTLRTLADMLDVVDPIFRKATEDIGMKDR